MLDFVNTYKRDSNEAKRNYYAAKLKFDVAEPKGKRDLHKLLYRYLEGLQWVMFYYYRGSQHWRWYYPYHYAPMISDLGSNIVSDFLGGATTILTFRTDTNCNADPAPYTPFQQLLCILPVTSMAKFLPPQYAELARGPFAKFFPDGFEIDLNGRTLPWEAHILIPFVDEDDFLSAE
jgi:5'-3' exoribonuclease 1